MSFKEYVTDYPNYHKHPVNKAIHLICIPVIILGMILFLTSSTLWGAILFVAGWIAQIIGHRIEGNRPAVSKNPLYAFAAPVWYIQTIWKLVNPSKKDD